jgi:hypothetical protein
VNLAVDFNPRLNSYRHYATKRLRSLFTMPTLNNPQRSLTELLVELEAAIHLCHRML